MAGQATQHPSLILPRLATWVGQWNLADSSQPRKEGPAQCPAHPALLRSDEDTVSPLLPLAPGHLLSKSIFSTMFLGLMLSSWLQMKICPDSSALQPYLLIHTFSWLSAGHMGRGVGCLNPKTNALEAGESGLTRPSPLGQLLQAALDWTAAGTGRDPLGQSQCSGAHSPLGHQRAH